MLAALDGAADVQSTVSTNCSKADQLSKRRV